MKTLLIIILIWLGIAFLLAWAWHRVRACEKRRKILMQFYADTLNLEDNSTKDSHDNRKEK